MCYHFSMKYIQVVLLKTCIHASLMFYGNGILLTFFSQKHVFSAHSVNSHVLNLFAFILPYWCAAVTQNTLLCHVSLGVCHILVRNCSNIQHHF